MTNQEMIAVITAHDAEKDKRIADVLHYPQCWDTAAYPTLEDALTEVYATFRCSDDNCMAAHDAALKRKVLEEAAEIAYEAETPLEAYQTLFTMAQGG